MCLLKIREKNPLKSKQNVFQTFWNKLIKCKIIKTLRNKNFYISNCQSKFICSFLFIRYDAHVFQLDLIHLELKKKHSQNKRLFSWKCKLCSSLWKAQVNFALICGSFACSEFEWVIYCNFLFILGITYLLIVVYSIFALIKSFDFIMLIFVASLWIS